ncbi:MAG: tRNA threonylcarbamoyladenosine dehydratase [Ruminococcus sp.]|nr:tRNA threonylcarbamoyladenosine dehydratase [Ruminococcus sp.]
MSEIFSRTELLLGKNAMERLHSARVAVFGVGGVGGYTVEALARSGVGSLDLIDNDTVSESNINRQIIALQSTIGQYKVDVAKARIADINPECTVRAHKMFFMPDTADYFDFSEFDYVVDAIDTVTGKIEIIMRAKAVGVPVISSMGAGNKLDPTAFEVADIYKTSVCPLARVMRREMRKRGVKSLKVVYSREEAIRPENSGVSPLSGKAVPGSAAFVPSAAGLIIASEVVRGIGSL